VLATLLCFVFRDFLNVPIRTDVLENKRNMTREGPNRKDYNKASLPFVEDICIVRSQTMNIRLIYYLFQFHLFCLDGISELDIFLP